VKKAAALQCREPHKVRGDLVKWYAMLFLVLILAVSATFTAC